ncbi:hypothetical protein [Streptococcus pluranimalium]
MVMLAFASLLIDLLGLVIVIIVLRDKNNCQLTFGRF